MKKWERQYDDWKTNQPESKILGYCVDGDELYGGESGVFIEEGFVRAERWEEYSIGLLNGIKGVFGEDSY